MQRIWESYRVAFEQPLSSQQPITPLAVAIACRFSTRVRLMAALPVESVISWDEAGKQLRQAQQATYPSLKRHQQQHPLLEEVLAIPDSIQEYNR